MKLLVMQAFHSSVIYSLFLPNISPSTLFKDCLSPCHSLNLRDRDSHPNKKRLIYFYLNFKASVFKRREDKGFSDGG